MKKSFVALCSMSFIVGLSGNVFGLSFNDFSSTDGLTLNGSAATATTGDGEVLRLTPATFGQSGSAFSTETVNAADFSSYFQFRITGPGYGGADGIAFVVQSVSSSTGGGGGGMGYAGIPNSVGVEFDTWYNGEYGDPNANHVGIDINGSVNSLQTASLTPNLDGGDLWSAWVDYNGSDLEVRVNQTGIRPDDPLISQTLDIGTILGGVSDAYIGFTSGTGGAYANHDIVSWEYRDGYDPIGGGSASVPEPSTMLLLGTGLAGLVGIRRKQKKQ